MAHIPMPARNPRGVWALDNPKDDGALVAATLRGEGFQITLVQDAKRDGMLNFTVS
jgi:hypothetical protein